MWWEDQSNGDISKWTPDTGNDWSQNRIMPIAPTRPITGQQAFQSMVVSLKKISWPSVSPTSPRLREN